MFQFSNPNDRNSNVTNGKLPEMLKVQKQVSSNQNFKFGFESIASGSSMFQFILDSCVFAS